MDSAEETFMVQWRGRRLQQCPVECREQVEAHKDFLVIHFIWSISRHLDLVLPLDIGGLRKESEVNSAQLFLTLYKVIAQVTSHPSSHHLQVLWQQVHDEATGVGTLAVIATNLHTGRSGHRVIHH